MNNRQKRKREKMKRQSIHQILDLVLDINGLQESKKELTGDHPTAFLYFSGHVAEISVDVHENGWEPDNGPSFSRDVYLKNNDFRKLVNELRRIRK